MKPAPNLFSRPNWLYGAFGGKFVPDENFVQFRLKSPLEFIFPKNTFRFKFLYKIPPNLYYGRNGLSGAIGSKSVLERSFVHPKKYVFSWNFLMQPAPYHFFGPNWLYGALGGKIAPDENFAQLCLKRPLQFVFPKNTFSV